MRLDCNDRVDGEGCVHLQAADGAVRGRAGGSDGREQRPAPPQQRTGPGTGLPSGRRPGIVASLHR